MLIIKNIKIYKEIKKSQARPSLEFGPCLKAPYAGFYYFFCQILGRTTIKKRSGRQHVAYHSQIPATIAAGKSGWLIFFFQKLILNLKHLKITLITFLNQSLASKSTKNRSKIQNQLGNQLLSYLRTGFLGIFKVKKHSSQTSPIIWNHLE